MSDNAPDQLRGWAGRHRKARAEPLRRVPAFGSDNDLRAFRQRWTATVAVLSGSAAVFDGLSRPWPFVPAVIASAAVAWIVLWSIERNRRRTGRPFSAYDSD